MQNHLLDSTATFPAGISPGKKLFKVPIGQYTGRIVVLLHKAPGSSSASEIDLTFSDYPYNSWSENLSIITACADYPFDAVMDSLGNIFVIYTEDTSHDLVVCKLNFSGGNWSTQSPVTIYNGHDCFFPSITILKTNRIYVTFSRYSAGDYCIYTKYSDDDGDSWGSGASDSGEALSATVSSAYSKLIEFGSYLYVIYSQNGTNLSYRRKVNGNGSWDSEEDIASGSDFDEQFSAAISTDNRLAVVYDDGQLHYCEYDGKKWSGIASIDSTGGDFPQVKFFYNNPFVVYISNFGNDQNRLLYCQKLESNFSNPKVLELSKNVLDKVLCYCQTSASYDDLTLAAANSTAGDIYHSDSSALVKESNDALYLGLTRPFYYLKILLSSVGSEGQVSWQYYNGTNWINFVPYGNAYHLTSLDKELLFWKDHNSIPGDWQKRTIENSNLFWIRMVVNTPFNVGAVGSQITSISDTRALALLE